MGSGGVDFSNANINITLITLGLLSSAKASRLDKVHEQALMFSDNFSNPLQSRNRIDGTLIRRLIDILDITLGLSNSVSSIRRASA